MTQRYSGTKTPYYFGTTTQLAVPPEGYEAFHINHVGRHGSRYLSKPNKQDTLVCDVLIKARNSQQLTPLGEALYAHLTQLLLLNKDNYGLLTDLGCMQMQNIATRMASRFSHIINSGPLEILTTTIPRTKQSADLFLSVLALPSSQITIKQQPEEAQTTLRFFDYAPALEHYSSGKRIKHNLHTLHHAPQTVAINQAISSRFFLPRFIEQLTEGWRNENNKKINVPKFTLALFSLYQASLSFGPSILAQQSSDISQFFTDEEIEWLTTVATGESYLKIGPAFDANGIQSRVAAPLILAIFCTADQAITTSAPTTILRFAHAETLSPLATLLALPHTTDCAPEIIQYPEYWRADRVSPMAANLQFIFYRAKTAAQPVLVMVLHNETATSLPIPTHYYPFYVWEEVKTYYLTKLTSLGVNVDQDPMTMLNTLSILP